MEGYFQAYMTYLTCLVSCEPANYTVGGSYSTSPLNATFSIWHVLEMSHITQLVDGCMMMNKAEYIVDLCSRIFCNVGTFRTFTWFWHFVILDSIYYVLWSKIIGKFTRKGIQWVNYEEPLSYFVISLKLTLHIWYGLSMAWWWARKLYSGWLLVLNYGEPLSWRTCMKCVTGITWLV